MFKKNTRKRLLAGALATVMMLTMCPSWALADDEDIALLPANEEIAVPVDDSTPAADPTKTPADPTPSEPEAKPAEDQNTAPAPSEGGANGGTDSAEPGKNNASSDVSEDNSQNTNAADSTPDVKKDQPQDAADINDVSMASLDVDAQSWKDVQTIDAQYWITNRQAVGEDGSWKRSIDKDTVGEDGKSVAELAPPERRATADETYNTVFWQARVHHGLLHHQTTGSNDDKTQLGTEITSIRYKNDRLEYCAKDSSAWTAFAWNDQLVFYYLIRTDYSEMVQIDVSDWTVDKEQKLYPNRRSVTYQVYVEDGNEDGTDEPVASRTFWYNKAFKVSSVRVREIGNHPNYSIDRVELEPDNLGDPTKNENGEYRFSLDLNQIKAKHNATVKIYVKPNVQQVQLAYELNDGIIKSAENEYTHAGWVWPDETITTPTVEKTDCVFAGWYTDKALTQEWTGTKMPNENLTLYAKWTANTPTQPEPELTPAKYFVLLPNRDKPDDNHDQGEEFYLPSSKSNGGVDGLDLDTGYVGSLTKDGMDAVPKEGDSVTNIATGVSKEYLKVPTNLGFFTPDNWKENGTYKKDDLTHTSILGDNFKVNDIEIVWYTIKNQGMKDGKLDIHVDGYVKNVAINVTYHSNFGTDATYNDPTRTGNYYTALDYYPATELPTRDGYEFRGWYTDAACNTPYTAKVLMNSLDLYAKWVQKFNVSYFVDDQQYGATEEHAVGDNVTVRTAHPEKEGYTFKGWKTNNATVKDDGTFTMPEQNVRFDAEFEKNPAKQYTYTVNKHFYNEKGVEVKVENGTPNPAVENTAVSELYKDAAVNQTVNEKTYVYVPGLTTVTDKLETLTKDVTIDLYYYLNVEGGNDIPDAWEYRLTFKVVNGEWNDGGNADIVTYVQFKDQKTGEAFKDEAVVVPVTRIPAVGDKPNSGYHAGAWDTSPYDNYKVQKDTVFTYTYAKNSSGGHHHRKPTVTIPDDVPTGLNGDDHYAYIVGYPDKTVRPQNGITRAEVATIFFRLLTDETRNANSTKSNSYSDVAAGAWYNHAVSTLSAMGIVKGDSDGKFNPNAPITRAEFAAIAARFDDKANTTTADFSDIASHWAKNEISAASNNGWINGYPDGTFRPDNKITRAEAMTLVNRVLKRLPETAEDLHDDMIKWSDNSDASQWFYLAVQEATNSHYYQTKENQFEKWSELRDTRDWTELEK